MNLTTNVAEQVPQTPELMLTTFGAIFSIILIGGIAYTIYKVFV